MPPTPSQEPNGLILFGLCLIGAVALIGLLKFNHWLVTRRSVKGSAPQQPAPSVMSPPERAPAVAAPPVPGTGTAPGTKSVPGGNLTEDQLLLFLATQKTATGKWRFSGKSLYGLLGGNHGVFLQKMREIRGDGPAEDAPDDLMLTPIAGRRTRAAYYPDEPDLEYTSPPG